MFSKDIDKYDADELVRIRVKQLEKEKKDLGERLRILHKRVDHLERAYRKDEAPLLEQDYTRQQEEDRVTHEENIVSTRAAAKQKHREDLHSKKRLARMTEDYHARRQELAGAREQDYRARLAAANTAMEAEKAARFKQVSEERAARRAAYEEEEKAQREQEAEARRHEEGKLVFIADQRRMNSMLIHIFSCPFRARCRRGTCSSRRGRGGGRS